MRRRSRQKLETRYTALGTAEKAGPGCEAVGSDGDSVGDAR